LPSGRCSPTEALNLLRPAFEPKDAADELTQAIHRRMPIIGNGIVIKSHIAPRLMVVAHEADGRWTARIEGTFAVGGVKPTDVWEFEIDKVKALLPQPDTRGEAMKRATAAAEAARAEAATARAELEQARAALQAATEKMEKAEARAQAAEARAEAIASETTTKPDPEPQSRRRPGPKPGHPLWRLEAAAFTHQFFIEKKRGPSAGEVAEHLQIKYDGWEPPDSDIRALLRLLIRD
jgi:hypothetical protein